MVELIKMKQKEHFLVDGVNPRSETQRNKVKLNEVWGVPSEFLILGGQCINFPCACKSLSNAQPETDQRLNVVFPRRA